MRLRIAGGRVSCLDSTIPPCLHGAGRESWPGQPAHRDANRFGCGAGSARFVPARLRHAGLGVVGHDQPGTLLLEIKGMGKYGQRRSSCLPQSPDSGKTASVTRSRLLAAQAVRLHRESQYGYICSFCSPHVNLYGNRGMTRRLVHSSVLSSPRWGIAYAPGIPGWH
jgi:hypothetical protein